MMLSVPGDQMPSTDFDISELAPGSLQTPVIDYNWSYSPGNTHIRVTGTVFNDTGGPVQGVILTAVLHDQTGAPIAYGQSYVSPTYLPVEGKGTFDFMALVKKESGVTATRLVVSTKTSGY
jgi:hypothetical protein